jgi:arginyl-tRNA synthetase
LVSDDLFGEFHELIASILRRIAAQGRLPADLDLGRFAVEPPREPAHGDLSTNAAMVYAKEARPHFAIRASSRSRSPPRFVVFALARTWN